VPAQGRSLSQIVADAAADAVQRDGDREGSGETEGSGSGHLVSLPVDTVPHQRRQRSLSATSAPAGRPASAAAGGHKGVAFIKPGATYVEDLASLAEEVGSLLEGSAPTSFEVNADANAASVLLHQLQEQYASYDPGKQVSSGVRRISVVFICVSGRMVTHRILTWGGMPCMGSMHCCSPAFGQ
jgi:hypothetical protein